MNLTATICVIILMLFNGVLGFLFLFGKVKVVIVRRTAQPPKPVLSASPVIPSGKKSRGRPRKFTVTHNRGSVPHAAEQRNER